MAAESNTPADIEIWIEKVVKSCTTYRQVITAGKLIDIYVKQLRQTLPYYQATHIEGKLENIRLEQRDLIRNGAPNLIKG